MVAPLLQFAEGFWPALLLHLFQSSLIVIPLLLLGRVLKGASSRAQRLFWSLALLKLLIPLQLGGRLTANLIPSSLEGGAVLRLPGVGRFLASSPLPIDVGASGAAANTLLIAATLLWALGLLWAIGLGLRRGGAVETPRGEAMRRLAEALEGSGVELSALRLSDDRRPPRVEGLLAPRIILPRFLPERLSRLELRAVLLHEEFHRRRRDPLRQFLQRLMGAALCFFPLVAMLRRRLAHSVELLCDERVIATGIAPRTYARALARTLDACLSPVGAGVHLGGGGALSHRLDRIVRHGRYPDMSKHRFIVAVSMALILVGSFAPLAPVTAEESPAFDTPPRVEKAVPPEYPKKAIEANAQGVVLIKIQVDAQGRVTDSEVLEAIEGWPELTAAALAVLPQWRFVPAQLDGEPVASAVSLPIQFRLDGDGEKGKEGGKD